MITGRRRFYAVVFVQAMFLLGWAGYHEAALRGAPTVLLETRPVDPAEIIRGDYIILNYAIATVPKAVFSPPLTGNEYGHFGERVCVRLTRQGEFHAVEAATLGRCRCDAPPEGGPYELEGTIDYSGTDVMIDYGVGRYYVPEGKGTPRGALTARVAITSGCRALLKEIYVGGERYP